MWCATSIMMEPSKAEQPGSCKVYYIYHITSEKREKKRRMSK